MKRTFEGGARGMILLGVVGLLGVGAWGVGNMLSPDAVALALGVIFGILATAPALLLAAIINMRRPPAPPYSQPPVYTPRQLPPPTVIMLQLPDGTTRRVALLDDGTDRGAY